MTKKVPCNACGEVDRPSPLSPFTPDGRWACAKCKRVFHFFCSGAADDYYEICDDCFSKIVKEAS